MSKHHRIIGTHRGRVSMLKLSNRDVNILAHAQIQWAVTASRRKKAQVFLLPSQSQSVFSAHVVVDISKTTTRTSSSSQQEIHWRMTAFNFNGFLFHVAAWPVPLQVPKGDAVVESSISRLWHRVLWLKLLCSFFQAYPTSHSHGHCPPQPVQRLRVNETFLQNGF